MAPPIQASPALSARPCPRPAAQRGVALIITLVVLFLIVVIAVILATAVRSERSSARSDYDDKRAQAFASMAVDDVAATLRNNIPLNSQWGVGGGSLYVLGPGASSPSPLVPLYSGSAGLSISSTPPLTSGSVALNRPSLAALTQYPIMPYDSLFAGTAAASGTTPNSMLLGWIYVTQDGTRSTDTLNFSKNYDPVNNPIVGRYAYWTDAETCKVNLNTAGRASDTFRPPNPPSTTGTAGSDDNQIYCGQPCRVDLSKLQPGITTGTISLPTGQATYKYTAGTDSKLNPYFPPNSTNLPGRFNTIYDWAGLSQFIQTATAPTLDQIQQNVFYLTTRNYTPEINPWGENKTWWTFYPPGYSPSNPYPINQSPPPTNTAPVPSWQTGNNTNSPAYAPVVEPTHGASYAPEPRYSACFPDNRWYVHPWAASAWDSTTVGPSAGAASGATGAPISPVRPFQNFSAFCSAASATGWNNGPSVLNNGLGNGLGGTNVPCFNAVFLNIYNLLKRNDWPGMPHKSFVDKYGQAVCENIAINMMALADVTLTSWDGMPCALWDSWNYNSSAVSFPHRDQFGFYGNYMWQSPLAPDPGAPQYTGTSRWMEGNFGGPYIDAAYVSLRSSPSGQPKNTTQGGINGVYGFAPSITNANSYANIQITPSIKFMLPGNMPLDYTLTSSNLNRFAGSNSNLPFSLSITSVTVSATGLYNGKQVTYSGPNFTWGYKDDLKTAASGAVMGWRQVPTNVTLGGSSSPSGSDFYQTVTWPPYYVGPFDKLPGNNIQVTTTFRAGLSAYNQISYPVQIEVVPAAREDNDPDNSPSPGNPNIYGQQKLIFGGTPSGPMTIDASGLTGPTYYAIEVIDPRLGQVAAAWKFYTSQGPFSDTSGPNIDYAANQTNGRFDSSDLTWVNDRLLTDQNYYTSPRHNYQTATSITTMPGMGWLGLISTGGYTWPITAGSTAANTPLPWPCNPWATLDFGPATTNQYPPDWLLLDIFAMVFDHSYVSQTEGKININQRIDPFSGSAASAVNRIRPLLALIGNSTSTGWAGNGSTPGPISITPTQAQTIATNIANHTLSSSATPFTGLGEGTSNPLYLYAGQICQIAGVSDGTVITGATNTFSRQALIRDIASLVTTKSSDFDVHVVAQSIKFPPNQSITATTNPTVLAEQRFDTIVERATDLGPDNIPGTADDFYGPAAQPNNPSSNLWIPLASGSTQTPLTYAPSDPMLQDGVGVPPFYYKTIQTQLLNH